MEMNISAQTHSVIWFHFIFTFNVYGYVKQMYLPGVNLGK